MNRKEFNNRNPSYFGSSEISDPNKLVFNTQELPPLSLVCLTVTVSFLVASIPLAWGFSFTSSQKQTQEIIPSEATLWNFKDSQ